MPPAPSFPIISHPRRHCSTCKSYGFELSKNQANSDPPEPQTDPRYLVFINHAASLQSSVDLDDYIEESGARDAASRADATFYSQVALSSILRSSWLSPMERASALQSTREAIIQEYHLPREVFDRILSEPFRCLDGLTPLEFEIQRWSPVWESSVDDGLYGAGMGVIRFLIEHWISPSIDNGSNGPSVDGGMLDPRSALVVISRRACLRRLYPAAPESTVDDEETTNMLYQRIVMFIWSQNAGNENSVIGVGRRLAEIGADDYNVSVVNEPIHTAGEEQTAGSDSRFPSSYADRGSRFTALVSIRSFAAQLHKENSTAESVRRAIRLLSAVIHDTSIQRHRHSNPGPRYHPYSHTTLPFRSYRSRPNGLSESGDTSLPSAFVDQSSAESSRLLIEFIAARQAWTLAIGRNELKLSIHEQGSSSKLVHDSVSESSVEDAKSIAAPTAFAEVRLVPPPPDHRLVSEETSVEHVFTFPEVRLSTGLFQDKHNGKSSSRTARITPCFSSSQPGTLHKGGDSCISRFDDPRLLHAGELLLELRVQIRSSLDTLSGIETASEYSGRNQTEEAITDTSEFGESSWDTISIPDNSGTQSDVLSLETTDLMSSTFDTLSEDKTDSSWSRIQ